MNIYSVVLENYNGDVRVTSYEKYTSMLTVQQESAINKIGAAWFSIDDNLLIDIDFDGHSRTSKLIVDYIKRTNLKRYIEKL